MAVAQKPGTPSDTPSVGTSASTRCAVSKEEHVTSSVVGSDAPDTMAERRSKTCSTALRNSVSISRSRSSYTFSIVSYFICSPSSAAKRRCRAIGVSEPPGAMFASGSADRHRRRTSGAQHARTRTREPARAAEEEREMSIALASSCFASAAAGVSSSGHGWAPEFH